MAEEELRTVEEELQREAQEDAELRSKYGQRWTRPASVALNTQISEKIAGEPSHPAQAPLLPALLFTLPENRCHALPFLGLSLIWPSGMQGSSCRKGSVADYWDGRLQGTGQTLRLQVTATSACPSASRRTQGR